MSKTTKEIEQDLLKQFEEAVERGDAETATKIVRKHHMLYDLTKSDSD